MERNGPARPDALAPIVERRMTASQRSKPTAAKCAADAITSTIYRLRRRIERATPAVVPLQSISRVGYAFRAPLNCV